MDAITDLPGYRITEQLYAGSRTLVYRGVRESDRTPVVIKVLRNEYPSLSELVQFRNQYIIAQNLNIPSIVKPLDLVPYKNAYALIMEDFGGVSLCTYAQVAMDKNPSSESISLENFLDLALQLADILHYLYENKVIHKDIKPANILINPDSKQIKLINFSISSLLPKETQEIHNPNIIEGTLAYLSPEQTGRMNRGTDYRSDFYSLGVTFYELLTKQLPFRSDDPMELVHDHLAQQPIPVHQIKPAVPLILSQIVSKLMAKTADNRYQSALGLKHDLEICLAQLQKTGNIETFALGTRDITDHFLIPEKLYGRETEVDNLLAAFERVSTGCTEIMLVAGFSGIGKSALVQEVYKPITKARGYFITGKFDQFQRNVPYAAVVKAFKSLVKQLLTESETQLTTWKEKLLAAFGDNGQIIIDVIPDVELIVGKQPLVQELGATESQNRFNLVFQKFIRVFCSVEHPLVIFLDDLQWADSATLKLLQVMMADEETKYLFLLGAYRDNEVSRAHPLIMTLEALQNQGATINHITLAPLDIEHITNLIADTVRRDRASVILLAELVVSKTQGNPFFVNQFLRTLYEENLLIFNSEQRNWDWNISEIEAVGITDNVVELMVGKLRKMPASTQQVLRLAACVGNSFDLNTLSIVNEKSTTETFQELLPAIQDGLILATSKLGVTGEEIVQSHLVITTYKFLHDRVQQAAYTLIEETSKKTVHLQIGRLLWQNTSPEKRAEVIFAIVDHLNLGIELISNQSERTEIAKLNLIAGQKAKAATAYESAIKYLQAGLRLLVKDSWNSQYEVTLALHEEAAEVAFLRGDFDRMQKLAEVVQNCAKTLLDKIKVYEVQIQAYMSQNKLLEALNTALQVLKLLGVEFPSQVNPSDIEQAVGKTASILNGKRIEDLIDLPPMSDPYKLAAMKLLSSIFAPVYMAAPALLPLTLCKQVDLSVQYGNASVSPFAYANYGLLLCGIVGDIDSGYQLGQLALSLLSRLNAQEIKAKTLFIVNVFIRHWKEDLRETLEPLVSVYSSGLETGDLEYAGYGLMVYSYFAYFTGKELTALEKEMGTYRNATYRIKQETALNFQEIYWQAVLNLLGRSEDPCRLQGKAYDEQRRLPLHQQANDNLGVVFLYLNKFLLCYLFENYSEGIENTTITEKYLDALVGLPLIPVFHFYDSLVWLAVYSDTPQSEQQGILDRVQANQEKMQKWAHHAPMNYLHKFYLVEAERHRVLGEKVEAMEMYDKAIAMAQENEYINEEALAHELAAKFYLSWGKETIAQVYMQNAHYSYQIWGATAKVEDLEEKYPQFLARTSVKTTSQTNVNRKTIKPTTTSTNLGDTLDLATVMKASQAISGEIVLSNLLTRLMKIAIENAGAEKGFLILEKAGNWTIEAEGSVNRNEVSVLRSLPLNATADSSEIPLLATAIANYVIRTQENVVLNNATEEGQFTQDPYVAATKPKSILCTPLLHQGKLTGIFYLENNLIEGAFTTNRLELLKLLSAQIAISIENAQLYDQLEEYSRTQERKVIERTQELQQEIAVRIQTEIALSQSEEKFSTAFRSSPSPIAIARYAEGRYIEVNDSFLNTFSYSREDVIGFTPIELNLWAHLEESDRYKQLLQESGVIRNQEFDCRTSSGEVRKMLVSADIIELGGETCILLVTNDITERQRVEEALKESEGKYRDLVETSQDMIWSLDAEGRITFVNAAVKHIFGYSPEEMIGRQFSDFKPPEQLPKDNEIFQRILSGESVFQYETIQLAKDSRPINLRINSIVVRDSQGKVLGITGTASDITASKKAEAALQQAKEVADAANKAKSEFLSKMSHELRTPLNAILGFTQVLARDSSLSHIQQEQIGIISRSGEHLLTLINDVLEMSKIEAGRITLNPTSFDLYHLLHSLEEMLKLKADSKGLQLSLHINSNIPQYVKTDESKLRQVLINLLGNAIKFTAKGSITLRVAAISAKQKSPTDNEPRTITFEVEDTGHGIAPTEVDSLFEAFVQTDAGRKSQEGTGLGLPISRQFVQLMGGDITVSSTLNRGTIFSFDIQISSPEMAEVQPRQSRRRVIGLEPNQPSYRILAVDDKWESRLLLVHLLEPLGLEVREAANGQEAITIWETWKPHLIWMDMQMPVIDGYEATRQIKAKIQEEATVIVALTASAFEEERAIVLSSGCDDFVSKPFREEVIFAKMAEHLGVQYIYEDLSNFTLSQFGDQDLSVKTGEETEILTTTLAAMPTEWVIQLHEGAIDADADLILSLVATIPESDAFSAEVLADWVNNFRFDKITSLTEKLIP